MVTQIDVANKNQIEEVNNDISNEDKLLNFITSTQDTIQIKDESKNYIFFKKQYNRDNIIIWEKHKIWSDANGTTCWEKNCQGFYNSKKDILYLYPSSLMYYEVKSNQRKKVIHIGRHEIEMKQKITEFLLNKIKNEYKTKTQLTEEDLLNKLNEIDEKDRECSQHHFFYEKSIEDFKAHATNAIFSSKKTKDDLLKCYKECTLNISSIFIHSVYCNLSLEYDIEFTDNQNEYLEKIINNNDGRLFKQRIEHAFLENELTKREIIKLYNNENFCKRKKILDEIHNTKTIRITIKAKNNEIYQFKTTTEGFANCLKDHRQRYPYYDENSRQSIEYSFDDILLIKHGTKTLYQSKQHPAT